VYTLRPYQKGILDELNHLSSVALYMGTGTGKTLTSLDKFKHSSAGKLLVICPHSVINQWKKVINEHFPYLTVSEFKNSWSAKKKEKYLIDNRYTLDVVIINFESVYRIPFIKRLINDNWLIVVDEIHRIKNWGGKKSPVKSTRFIVSLGELTPYKIGLSATPTQGNYGGYIDYYPQLRFLGYTDLSFDEFYEKHVLYETKVYPTSPWGIKQIIGYQNKSEIDNVLKLMARRYTSTYDDFEPLHEKIILDKSRSYNKMVREKAIVDKDGNAILLNNSARKRTALKTMTTGTVMGKNQFSVRKFIVDNLIKLNWLEDFLLDTDEVIAIFYCYDVELENLKILMEKLGKKYVVINGETKNKSDVVQAGDYEVVLGQYQALSESIDGLHDWCHIEIFFAMPESSLLFKQALGRIDRDGQKKVPMYYYLIMQGTIDEDIMNLIEQKIEFSESVLEKLNYEESLTDEN
jgi:hypothetical protein